MREMERKLERESYRCSFYERDIERMRESELEEESVCIGVDRHTSCNTYIAATTLSGVHHNLNYCICKI